MAISDVELIGLVERKERSLSEQFSNKGSTQSFRPSNEAIHIPDSKGQSTTVQVKELSAASRVRERDFNRCIDAAGSRHQCRLQKVRAISGK